MNRYDFYLVLRLSGMALPSLNNLSKPDYYSLLFSVLTIGCLLLVIRAIILGHSPIQIVLLSALTTYGLVIALDRFSEVAYLKRLSAVPLGILGVITYIIGAPTDLPIFFIILGTGGVVDLLWDPFSAYDDSLP